MASEIDVERIVGLFKNAESAAEVRRCELLLRALISRSGTPVIRAETAYFFASSESNLSLTGDWNNWKPTDVLTRMSDASSYHYCKKKFPIDARLAYRMLAHGESVLDPLNPQQEVEVFGTNSVVKMPAYREERLLIDLPKHVRRAKLIEIDVPGEGKI